MELNLDLASTTKSTKELHVLGQTSGGSGAVTVNANSGFNLRFDVPESLQKKLKASTTGGSGNVTTATSEGATPIPIGHHGKQRI
jgi:hypothetical protein